jgi:MFS family permease
MFSVEFLAIAATSGLFAFLLVRSPPTAFKVLAALVAANGLYVDVGIAVTASRVAVVMMLPWLVARLLWDSHASTPRHLGAWSILLVGYALAVTVFSFLFWTPPIAHATADFRVEYRWLIQWLSFVVAVSPVLAGPLILRTPEHALMALRWFIIGVGVLCAIAVLQWLADQLFGITVLRIAREGLLGGHFEEAVFEVAGVEISRANSFAREPKDLGAAAAIALTALGMFGLPRDSRGASAPVRGTLLVFAMLALGLLVTFSTTGFVLGALGLLFVASWPIVAYLLGWHRLPRIGPVLLAAFAAVLVLSIYSGGGYLDLLLEERVYSRLGQVEDYDEVTIEFLAENPAYWITGVGLGLVPFFANDYLPLDPALLAYMLNYTWDPKAGLLRVLASLGLIGVVLFAGLFRVIFHHLGMRTGAGLPPGTTELRAKAAVFLAFIAAVYCVRAIDEIFWCLAGILCALGVNTARAAAMAPASRQAAPVRDVAALHSSR